MTLQLCILVISLLIQLADLAHTFGVL